MGSDNYYILVDDIDMIRHQLQTFAEYNFARDVAGRMQALDLSQSALAARVRVSRAMVGKWLNKGAKPHGKERFKELGMALGMDETGLNAFLQANCYPRLYIKNPLDIACRFVLTRSAGEERIVPMYREFIKRYRLDCYTLSNDPLEISTEQLSGEFKSIETIGSFDEWLSRNNKIFRAIDKSYLPHARLIRFILLYLGDANINDLYVAEELPIAIKNMLYPLKADKEIAVRGLRAKLIVFGLYENMTEDEINVMLDFVKLRPLTEPLAHIDHVILTALRCAHERYPYFELHNAQKMIKGLGENAAPDMLRFYEEQKDRAARFVDYYEAQGHKGEIERLFEEAYTAYAGNGILHYMRDIFALLVDSGDLTSEDVKEYTMLMHTY